VLNGRRGRPRARLAVRRGAVGVGVVQGFGPIGGREDRAGECRGFGHGGFRFDISAGARRRGAARTDRLGVSGLGAVRLGNAVGVHGHTAGRGNWRGVLQLEVTAGVHDHTAGRKRRRGVLRLAITVNVHEHTARRRRRRRRRMVQLEVTTSIYDRTTGQGRQPGVAHLAIAASVYDRAAGRGLRRQAARLEANARWCKAS